MISIDLHLHTVYSDGTDTPEELLAKVKEAGIGLFSVTDHDAIRGAYLMRELLTDGDPQFLPGVEFSCKDEGGKYHILGYGYDPEADPVRRVVDTGHAYRMNKVRARLAYLDEKFGFSFPQAEIDALLALDNPGKPHIGNLMVKYGYAETKEEAIRKYINSLHSRGSYVRPEEAIAGILASGGVPVLAHPAYGSGDQLILGEEMEERLRRLTGFGLQGLEAFYSGFTEKITRELLSFADRFDLYVTAGSDYHGTNKLIPIGDTNLAADQPCPPRLWSFLERVLTDGSV